MPKERRKGRMGGGTKGRKGGTKGRHSRKVLKEGRTEDFQRKERKKEGRKRTNYCKKIFQRHTLPWVAVFLPLFVAAPRQQEAHTPTLQSGCRPHLLTVPASRHER